MEFGKSSHISFLDNWTNNNDASVCTDNESATTWNNWGASQRDLFILDYEGNVAFHENISSGIPENLESTITNLINQIPNN